MTEKEKDACPITGRMSTNQPNLQNLPIRKEEGRRIRDLFFPRPVTKERP
jgi:DNA polymerase-1